MRSLNNRVGLVRDMLINEETLALEEMLKFGAGGNFISSLQTRKLFRNAYHTSTIFPRLRLEKWQELEHPDAMKFLREQTLDMLKLSNYPDDQHELSKRVTI